MSQFAFLAAKSPPTTFRNSAIAKGDRRRALFRPVKRQITLRLDADLIDW